MSIKKLSSYKVKSNIKKVEQEFTLTVFSENRSGILARIVAVIVKRHINIESISVSKSALEGVHRHTIVVNIEEERVRKLVSQIDKQVDILKAFYYCNDEIVYQEIALYKVLPKIFFHGNKAETLIRKHNARILRIEKEYVVIEKTGHQHETEDLYEALLEYGVYEFVRSGRVAVVKQMERLNKYLETLAEERNGN